MKTRNPIGKKRAGRIAARGTSETGGLSLPRLFLFLEVFVDKDIPERSTK